MVGWIVRVSCCGQSGKKTAIAKIFPLWSPVPNNLINGLGHRDVLVEEDGVQRVHD